MNGMIFGQGGFEPKGKKNRMVGAATSSQTFVDALNVYGKGYFLGYSSLKMGSATPIIRITIDGSVVLNDDALNGYVIVGPMRFETSLRIEHRLDAPSSTVRSWTSYLLD